MSQKRDIYNEQNYAKKYNLLSFIGTRYLEYRDLPKLIKEYIKGTVTLDFGCGPGQTSIYLKMFGLNVESMDINKDAINLAKERDPFGKYELINVGKIPRTDNSYDFVFAGWVLPHVATKEKMCNMVKEIARVLKKGGTFIAIVNTEHTYKNEWLSYDTKFDENLNLYSGALAKILFKEGNFSMLGYYWSLEDYEEAIVEAGLKVERIHLSFGNDSEGYKWINEKEKPFSAMIVAQKR